ncbi:hypothetical protein [Bacillus cereus]|uniref:hypothetical protein n=1 Tax=Bacillus cereus TaxID=1396 RepID=UPI000BF7A253|nr:hypothetical protein [Bacillus cereus]PFJ22605.1 hypothetical protein COI92_29160 [Bacillus anthracis]PGW01305.1 hypothetical protein COD87_27840 [Bacillus cereus]
MADFTELHFRVKLKKNIPNDVLNIIRYMIDNLDKPISLPKHDFFATSRWSSMLSANSDNGRMVKKCTSFENNDSAWHLSVTSLFRETGEIKLFFEWLYEYIDEQWLSFLGYINYDTRDHPVLIYYSDDGMKYIFVNCNETEEADSVLYNWNTNEL